MQKSANNDTKNVFVRTKSFHNKFKAEKPPFSDIEKQFMSILSF